MVRPEARYLVTSCWKLYEIRAVRERKGWVKPEEHRLENPRKLQIADSFCVQNKINVKVP